MLFEFRAFRQHVRAEFRFERAQTVHFVWEKNDKMQFASAVWNADGSEAVALRITKILIFFAHHRDIDRRAAANMKRPRLRCGIGKLICPRRLEINCVRKHEPGHPIQRSCWNQIADSVTRLPGHPLVDVLRCAGGIFAKINWLEWRAVMFFHESAE